MNNDTIEGLTRIASVAAAGYLIHGFKGAVAGVLLTFVVFGLIKDVMAVQYEIAKRTK